MESLSRYAPTFLSVLRIVAAIIFFEHGTSKLFGWPQPWPANGGAPVMFSMYWCAAVIEIVGGVLLFLGLCTRPVAFILSGEMAFAYFLSHHARNLYPIVNGGDAAILYCFTFLYIFFAGGGPISIDAMWKKK
jgi:putative oxidoreductase